MCKYRVYYQTQEIILMNMFHCVKPNFLVLYLHILFNRFRIERSRTIIPTLITAIIRAVSEEVVEDESEKRQTPKRMSNRKSSIDNLVKVRSCLTKKKNERLSLNSNAISRKKTINKDYFYDLLFTRKNLKLVHIVCHDKQEHLGKKCDENLMFVEQ